MHAADIACSRCCGSGVIVVHNSFAPAQPCPQCKGKGAIAVMVPDAEPSADLQAAQCELDKATIKYEQLWTEYQRLQGMPFGTCQEEVDQAYAAFKIAEKDAQEWAVKVKSLSV